MITKLPNFAKPFTNTLHRICLNALADTNSDTLRQRGVDAFKTLIGLSDRVDWQISELVTGTKSTNPGVTDSMLKVLYEAVSKAGGAMSDVSRKAILNLIDGESGEPDSMAITHARLLGAMIRVLPEDTARSLVKYVSWTLQAMLTNQGIAFLPPNLAVSLCLRLTLSWWKHRTR
jgi:hypothetical protein